MSYSLFIDFNGPYTLESLNVSSAKVSESIDGTTFLTLEVPAQFNSAPLAPPFANVLLLENGTDLRFIGWLDEAPREVSGDSCRMRYVFSGGHRWLTRKFMTQNRAGLVILGGAAGAGTTEPAKEFSAVYQEIINNVGGNIDAMTESAVNALYSHTIPNRFRSDVTCFDALSNLLSFAPTASLRWSYEISIPKLNIVKSEGAATFTFNASTQSLVSAQLTPRYDLLADSMIVYFVRDDAIVGNSTIGPAYGQGSGGDAGALGANRTLLQTYDVSVINNLPSSNIAEILAAWHQKLHVDGSIEEAAINWSLPLGSVVGFGGTLFSQFASNTTTIVSIERDLFAERTVYEFGVLPQRQIYKIGDYDTGTPSTAQTHNNQALSFPSTGINIPNSVNPSQGTTVDGDGIQTDGNVEAEDITANGDITCENLTVNATATFQGVATFNAEPVFQQGATFNGEIDAGSQHIIGNTIKANTNYQLGTDTFTAISVQRCDGKTMKVLGTGWV
jgi:hypothetical protein